MREQIPNELGSERKLLVIDKVALNSMGRVLALLVKVSSVDDRWDTLINEREVAQMHHDSRDASLGVLLEVISIAEVVLIDREQFTQLLKSAPHFARKVFLALSELENRENNLRFNPQEDGPRGEEVEVPKKGDRKRDELGEHAKVVGVGRPGVVPVPLKDAELGPASQLVHAVQHAVDIRGALGVERPVAADKLAGLDAPEHDVIDDVKLT